MSASGEKPSTPSLEPNTSQSTSSKKPEQPRGSTATDNTKLRKASTLSSQAQKKPPGVYVWRHPMPVKYPSDMKTPTRWQHTSNSSSGCSSTCLSVPNFRSTKKGIPDRRSEESRHRPDLANKSAHSPAPLLAQEQEILDKRSLAHYLEYAYILFRFLIESISKSAIRPLVNWISRRLFIACL